MMGGVNQPTSSLEARTIAAAAADPVCAAILDRMPHLGLSEWWLTAGAVFQNVWNAVKGHAPGYGRLRGPLEQWYRSMDRLRPGAVIWDLKATAVGDLSTTLRPDRR